MRIFLPFCILIMVLLSLDAQRVDAQLLSPFLAKEGLQTATAKAKDTLASDATLTFVATLALETDVIQSEFNLDNGKANAWGYVFYSPSKQQSVTIVVIKILILYQAFGIDLPIPLPSDLVNPLDVSLNYANSDAMVNRLETDTAYKRYRSELPEVTPNFLSLGQLLEGDTLPNGFPVDQPVWSVIFSGQEDSSMNCFVAARTGEVVCVRLSFPTLAAPETGRETTGTSLTAAPNPTGGMTRITLHLPEDHATARDAELSVYNTLGVRVMSLTPILSESNTQTAEFDTEALPEGIYYCRLHAPGWNGATVPIVVRR